MTQQIQRLEVWGGDRGVEHHSRMPGLEVWLYSQPYDDASSGGDVYYLSSCASGRISRLLLATGDGPQQGPSGTAVGKRRESRRGLDTGSARDVELRGIASLDRFLAQPKWEMSAQMTESNNQP
jgi:hypothetical protein